MHWSEWECEKENRLVWRLLFTLLALICNYFWQSVVIVCMVIICATYFLLVSGMFESLVQLLLGLENIPSIVVSLLILGIIVALLSRYYQSVRYGVPFQVNLYDTLDILIEISGSIFMGIILPFLIISQFSDVTRVYVTLGDIFLYTIILVNLIAAIFISLLATKRVKMFGNSLRKSLILYSLVLIFALSFLYILVVMRHPLLYSQYNWLYTLSLTIVSFYVLAVVIVAFYNLVCRVLGELGSPVIFRRSKQEDNRPFYLVAVRHSADEWICIPCRLRKVKKGVRSLFDFGHSISRRRHIVITKGDFKIMSIKNLNLQQCDGWRIVSEPKVSPIHIPSISQSNKIRETKIWNSRLRQWVEPSQEER